MKKFFIFLLSLFIFMQVSAQKNIEIKPSQLPQPTTDFILGNLPGSQIYKAFKVETNGTVTYSVGVIVNKNKHLYIFDENGKFLKKGDNREGSRSSEALQPQTQSRDQQPATPPVKVNDQVPTKLDPQVTRQVESKQVVKPQQPMQTKQPVQSLNKTDTKQLSQPQQPMQTKQPVQSINKTDTKQLSQPQQPMQTKQVIKTVPKK